MGKRKVAAEVVSFCLGDIHAAGYNPRVISDEAYAALARSIEKFGCVEPIIVNVRGGKNTIVGGHQRYEILCDAGVKKCLCVTVDLSDKDEKLLNLTLNNPAAQGEFIEELDKYIDSIRDQLGDEDYLGMRIDALRSELEEKEGLTAGDDAPDLPADKDVITRLGDLWQLGDHQLLCGDSIVGEDMSKAFGSRFADMVFTDPPYNMAYKSKKLGGIKNDNMAEAKFVRFILASTVTIEKVLRDGGSYYICMSAAEYPTVYHQLRKISFSGRQIVWMKPSTGLGAQEYRPQFEVMLYGYAGKRDKRTFNGARRESDLWEFEADRGVVARDNGDGMILEMGDGIETVQVVLDKRSDGKVVNFDGSLSDVWRFSRPRGEYVHPTQKPVALVARAILNSSNKGDTVFDAFAGSGTTMIACEKLERKCLAVELDPKYCDVTVARWEKFTGKKAVKVKNE